MRLALVEAVYDYRMSYLNEWRTAWSNMAESAQSINVLSPLSIAYFKRELHSFDLIVCLHSVNADSNSWLPRVQGILLERKCPMVMFVGNEYSNPWLSMETRLGHIGSLHPEIVASQLNIESAEWLYRGRARRIIAAPPGLPSGIRPSKVRGRSVDFGVRGFRYPWYLLDDARNDILIAVEAAVLKNGGSSDSSETHRFAKDEWYQFLASAKITASSEAGGRYIFDTDEVWRPVLNRLSRESGIARMIGNDAMGMSFARRLPAPLKSMLRRLAGSVGIEQGSIAEVDSGLVEELRSLVQVDQFPHAYGKGLSSRHFDAIATGTWQILQPGHYGGVLTADVHYTTWDPEQPELIVSNSLEAYRDGRAENAFVSLEPNHTYRSRVRDILKAIDLRAIDIEYPSP